MTAPINTLLAALATAALASQAPAATIVEYFDNYGDASIALHGQGTATGGWTGAWGGTSPTGSPSYAPLYQPASSLTFDSPNYSNAGNATGSNGGVARRAASNSANAAHYAVRNFEAMTGTIWISALARFDTTTGDALLTLDSPTGTANSFIGLRNQDATFRTAAGLADSDEFGPGIADIVYPTNTTFLYLLRIDMNVAGVDSAEDRVDFWIFDADAGTSIPALPSSFAGLPATPSFSKTGDFFGPTFSSIGVSFEETAQIDAIRISNDPDGYAKVTSVPEPGALAALGFGLMALPRRRR